MCHLEMCMFVVRNTMRLTKNQHLTEYVKVPSSVGAVREQPRTDHSIIVSKFHIVEKDRHNRSSQFL